MVCSPTQPHVMAGEVIVRLIMDPVQKAVINHTFGVSIPPKKKQVISCNVCQLRFNSDVKIDIVEEKGKVKGSVSNQVSSSEGGSFLPKPGTTALPPAAATSPSKSTNGAPGTVSESEEEKAKKLLYCSLCKVAVNSLSQLEAHNTGSKHKTMVEARNGAGPIKSYPRPGSRLKMQNGSKGSGLQNKTFHCEICDVHVNSEIQLKQAKLAFQKDMMKPLAPAFLSSPLAAAAVSSALSLPPRPSASLFQAAAIPPALLRPGHGPIRATPASILFAPY
ncbi:hypothetical protein MG293_004314 [Ovis ammon polii]|uniref:U1-type domain-containing protein n=1 Tax=Ovis ammon polii TaxID=230172 RepID=A0AAD4YDK0_OVIAM|nr:hypothetical protein MG293_004314 [Ovis ammon polii]